MVCGIRLAVEYWRWHRFNIVTTTNISGGDAGRKPRPYPRKPRFVVGKFARFGKTVASAPAGMPNHEESVAPY